MNDTTGILFVVALAAMMLFVANAESRNSRGGGERVGGCFPILFIAIAIVIALWLARL